MAQRGVKIIVLDDEGVNAELLDFRLSQSVERIANLEVHFEQMCSKISELTTIVQLQQQQLGMLRWIAMVSCAAIIGSVVKSLV